MRKVSLFGLVIEYLFGRKYWANIVNARGTLKGELASFIFTSRKDADDHRLRLMTNASFQWLETVSFRSRKNYDQDQKTVRERGGAE